MSDSLVPRSNACPSCREIIRPLHLLASPAAPLYFRCKQCKAKLRMKRIGFFFRAMAWIFVGSVLMMFVGILFAGLIAPQLHFLARVAIGLVPASTMAIYIAVQYPLQEYRLTVCNNDLAAQTSERTYRSLGVLGFLAFFVALGGVGVTVLLYGEVLVHALTATDDDAMPNVANLPSYGKLDPTWTVYDLNRRPKRAMDWKGKVVFINVWATWCPPCVEEMPSIDRLYQSFRGNPKIEFVILSGETMGKVRAFKARKTWSLPFYVMMKGLPQALQTRGIPATFIADKKGNIVYKHTGGKNWNTTDVRRFLRDLIQAGD